MGQIEKPPVKFEISKPGIRNFVRLVYDLETDRQFDDLPKDERAKLCELVIGVVTASTTDWMVQTCSAGRHNQQQAINDAVRGVVKRWLMPPEPEPVPAPAPDPVPMAVAKRPGRPRKDQPQVSEN